MRNSSKIHLTVHHLAVFIYLFIFCYFFLFLSLICSYQRNRKKQQQQHIGYAPDPKDVRVQCVYIRGGYNEWYDTYCRRWIADDHGEDEDDDDDEQTKNII